MSRTCSNCGPSLTSPCRSHAKAGRAELLGLRRLGSHLSHAHERRRLNARLVASALGAIAAIFRTAAGLDAQEDAALDAVVGIVDIGVGLGRPGRASRTTQRQLINGAKFRDGFHGGDFTEFAGGRLALARGPGAAPRWLPGREPPKGYGGTRFLRPLCIRNKELATQMAEARDRPHRSERNPCAGFARGVRV